MELRIIVSWPTHPAYFMLYFILLFPLFLVLPQLYVFLLSLTGIPPRLSSILGTLLFWASLLFSFFNIVIKEIETGQTRITFETKYVSFMGMYFPIIHPRIVRDKIIIAVNIGGALIPGILSLVLLAHMLYMPSLLLKTVLIIFGVALITYYFSRAIPGVGIVVPGILPPLASVVLTLLLVGEPHFSVPVAYIGGTLGSLLGADIIRLFRDLDRFVYRYGSTMLSIGGAGTFDGIFLSGVFAVLFILLFI